MKISTMEKIAILSNELDDVISQLSENVHKYFNNGDGNDLKTKSNKLIADIEGRFFSNNSDESDYDLLLNVIHLSDLIGKTLKSDEEYCEELRKEMNEIVNRYKNKDSYIEIDED